MVSSASAMALAAVVGDDVIMSLIVAAFPMSVDAAGWLSLLMCRIVLLLVAGDDVADSCIISK